jgi:hypothetical protein
VPLPGLGITTQLASFQSVGWVADAMRSVKTTGEDVREAGVKVAYILVAYLIQADCGAVIQAGNDVVDFGARYPVEFVAEVSLARGEFRGRASGGASAGGNSVFRKVSHLSWKSAAPSIGGIRQQWAWSCLIVLQTLQCSVSVSRRAL